MSKVVAKFEKVSLEQFRESFVKLNLAIFGKKSANSFVNELVEKVYRDIKLPQRSTTGSAGYDFYAPYDIELKPNEVLTIPTGIRCKIDEGWFLGCFPRSGHGFKYRLALANTVGIIDSDYYNSDNEGHIMLKLCNGNINTLNIEKGNGMMQGILLPYGLAADDNTDGIRNGGFGSTDK